MRKRHQTSNAINVTFLLQHALALRVACFQGSLLRLKAFVSSANSAAFIQSLDKAPGMIGVKKIPALKARLISK